MTLSHRFVLASASPARLQTLRDAGVAPRVQVSGVDESQVTDTDPSTVATRLAELKAAAVVATVDADDVSWVLGCDSVLELDGQVLGKPGDADDARDRWRAMRGRSGVLHTGHCLVEVGSHRAVARAVGTVVHFADVTDAEVDAYVASGEPLHVAGAFTIDGLGGAFVRGVEGDPHNVVGLSLPVLREMFAELGVRWTDLWTPAEPADLRHLLHVGGREFSLHRARPEDVPELVALLADDELGAARETAPLSRYLTAFEAIDRDPNQLLASVRDESGVVVGTMQLTIIPGLSRSAATRLQVEAVRIARSARGDGLGAAMLHWAHEYGRARGATLAQLTTDKTRGDAHRFYARLGYVASHEGLKLSLDAPGHS